MYNIRIVRKENNETIAIINHVSHIVNNSEINLIYLFDKDGLYLGLIDTDKNDIKIKCEEK